MSIPRTKEIRIPALELLAEKELLKFKDFELPLAEHFNLTLNERTERYKSGNGRRFFNRISWALSSLYIDGLVDRPRRGVYKIKKQGLRFLQKLTR